VWPHFAKIVGDDAAARDLFDRIMANPQNLILLYVVLPRQNGYQVCRMLKRSPETSPIPVILVTGKDQPSDRFWGMRQGADEYVTKPFAPDALVSSIQRFV